MVNAAAVRGLIERFGKAEARVKSGAVSRVAGVDGYFAVKSSAGDTVYLVQTTPSAERCSCEDFKNRGKAHGTPCKHLLAAQLFSESATAAHKAAKPAMPASAQASAVDEELLNEVIFGSGRAA
jgi:hypothetical protein